MIKNILADRRKRLVYDPVQSLLENIHVFFQAVERPIYEVINLKNKEKKTYHIGKVHGAMKPIWRLSQANFSSNSTNIW